MLAFQPGFYPLLLPELGLAFGDFTDSGNWEILETARQSALARLRQVASKVTHLLEVHANDHPDHLKEVLTSRFLKPLGL